MKLYTQALAAVVVVGLAVNARASYSVSAQDNHPFASAQTTSPGLSGTSTIALEIPTADAAAYYAGNDETLTVKAVTSSGAMTGGNLTGSADPFTITVTGLADGTLMTPGVVYDLTLSWTIASIPPGTYAFPGNYVIRDQEYIDQSPDDGSDVASSTAFDYVNIRAASVPEPAQTVAGAMLLGFGGLVFAGRRLFKKQAA